MTRELETEIGGFDFAAVLCAYYTAAREGSDEKRSACLRWLRGEYATKTEAKAALGVGSIIDDDNWYAYIKLLAVFLRKIGYAGLVVIIDECVNLYKIPNRISRENNYEKLLSMFNDTLQGKASGLTLLFGGTPQFLEDTRRGLFSYEALRSRLCDGQFSGGGYKNLLGPVIRLRRLSDDELFALISRLARLHGQNYHWEPRITQEEMTEFLRICTALRGGGFADYAPGNPAGFLYGAEHPSSEQGGDVCRRRRQRRDYAQPRRHRGRETTGARSGRGRRLLRRKRGYRVGPPVNLQKIMSSRILNSDDLRRNGHKAVKTAVKPLAADWFGHSFYRKTPAKRKKRAHRSCEERLYKFRKRLRTKGLCI